MGDQERIGRGAGLRPAFYALSSGGWRDYVTLLHPPYTLWHLGYVTLGAAAAPSVDLYRYGWTALAFFLAVGIGAHALDELQGRPLNTRIPRPALWSMALVSIGGAIAIGILGAISVSPWIGLFIAAGAFLLFAYNLEWQRGFFHSGFWFALSWGAFPFVSAYWAVSASFDVGPLFLAFGCFLLSMAQRRLSSSVRKVRRDVRRISGTVEYNDGALGRIDARALVGAPEAALRALTLAVIALAGGWMVVRAT